MTKGRSGGTQFLVLAGLPGAGKTALLRSSDVPVLDLEGLAGHRGSAYGGLGLPPQPPQGAFDAAIAAALAEGGVFLVEDEGPFIGSLTVPSPVRGAIESAPVLMVSASREARIERLTSEYGALEPQQLIRATQRIRRRLGGQTADRAISHFAARRPEAGIAALLPYFDAAYEYRWAVLTREARGQITSCPASQQGLRQAVLGLSKIASLCSWAAEP